LYNNFRETTRFQEGNWVSWYTRSTLWLRKYNALWEIYVFC